MFCNDNLVVFKILFRFGCSFCYPVFVQLHSDRATQPHSDRATQLHSDRATQLHSDRATQLHSDRGTKLLSDTATYGHRDIGTQRSESLTDRTLKVMRVGQVTRSRLASLLPSVSITAGYLTGRQSRNMMPHLQKEKALVGSDYCAAARGVPGGAAFSCWPSQPLGERDVIVSTLLANA